MVQNDSLLKQVYWQRKDRKRKVVSHYYIQRIGYGIGWGWYESQRQGLLAFRSNTEISITKDGSLESRNALPPLVTSHRATKSYYSPPFPADAHIVAYVKPSFRIAMWMLQWNHEDRGISSTRSFYCLLLPILFIPCVYFILQNKERNLLKKNFSRDFYSFYFIFFAIYYIIFRIKSLKRTNKYLNAQKNLYQILVNQILNIRRLFRVQIKSAINSLGRVNPTNYLNIIILLN